MRIRLPLNILIVLIFFSASALLNSQSLPDNSNYSQTIRLSCRKRADEKNLFLLSNLESNRNLFDTIRPAKDDKIPYEKKPRFHPVRFAIVTGGLATAWLGMHIYYSNTWWKDRAHYFKYAEDPYYARDIDKLSHIYTANLISVSSAKFYEWSGLNPTLAIVVGSSTAIAYETYIEINDGLSPNWGFDWGDMAGNFIGALFPIAQHFVKPLQCFNFKWSFEPSWINRKLRNYPDLLDDYTSMKFWITVSPHDLLPKKMARYYPSFLGFGVGFNLQNASHATGATHAFKEYYLAFDIDVRKLPGNTEFLKKMKEVLNFYHIPMPGIKIYKNTVWYGLLF